MATFGTTYPTIFRYIGEHFNNSLQSNASGSLLTRFRNDTSNEEMLLNDVVNKTYVLEHCIIHDIFRMSTREQIASAFQCDIHDVQNFIITQLKKELAIKYEVLPISHFDFHWMAFAYVIDDISSNYMNNKITPPTQIDFKQCFTREKFLIRRAKQAGHDMKCSICLDKFRSCQIIAKTSCNHRFHINCLRNVYKNRMSTCPICRNNL